jgi:hypothetical protein
MLLGIVWRRLWWVDGKAGVEIHVCTYLAYCHMFVAGFGCDRARFVSHFLWRFLPSLGLAGHFYIDIG